MLYLFKLKKSYVLDLFSGTGSFGLECISRGASKVYFIENYDKSIEIFKDKLGYNPIFFSYPFGEYSTEQKNYIKQKFKYAFGQHSGVIDFNKNIYELPRFPINEKYGDLKRFSFLLNLFGPLLKSKSVVYMVTSCPISAISLARSTAKNTIPPNWVAGNDAGQTNATFMNFSFLYAF